MASAISPAERLQRAALALAEARQINTDTVTGRQRTYAIARKRTKLRAAQSNARDAKRKQQNPTVTEIAEVEQILTAVNALWPKP